MSLRHISACLGIAFLALGGSAYPQSSDRPQPTADEEQKDPEAKPQIPKNADVDATVWGAVFYATGTPAETVASKAGPKNFQTSQSAWEV